MKFLLIILTMIIIFNPAWVWAGAWTQNPGNGFVSTEYIYYETSSEFDRDGEKVSLSNDGKYRKQSIHLYFEQGLTERLSALGSLYYDFLDYDDSSSNLDQHGFSDQRLGLRWCLNEDPFVFSLQETVKIPAGYNDNKDLPLGNNQVDLESWFLFGKNFGYGRRAFYVNLELGYAVRFEQPPDAIKWQTLLGYKGIKNVEVSLAWDATRSIGSGEQTYVGKNVLAFVDYDLDRIDLSCVYTITPRLAISASYFVHLDGKSTGAGDGIILGTKILW